MQYLGVILKAEDDLDVLQRAYLQEENSRLRTYYAENIIGKQIPDIDVQEYVFFELHYAYLSRLYMILFKQIGRAISKKEKERYWSVHRNFLKLLLNVPPFLEVHKNAKIFEDYSIDFRDEVDRVIAEQEDIRLPGNR